MKTVQMTLDEILVAEVDEAARKLGTSRSGFTRDALRTALEELRNRDLERQHRDGYLREPVRPGEFWDAEDEPSWGEE
ncbi:MAG TPA: ribbon-helix-helix protein, CopG family [Thermoanaerobaculia bacterium]|nr:ribbon-helix-helix protein, CopG family [Thermoanaerobaculia bacterium]